MGAFSGKFISDPGHNTFKEILQRIGEAIEKAESDNNPSLKQVSVEITIRGSEREETFKIPQESLREVLEILKLNS